MTRPVGLLVLVGLLAAAAPDDDPAATLKAHGVAATADGVAAYLRAWVPDAAQAKRLAGLVARLGSDDFDEREQATEALANAGPAAVEPLRQASKNPDAEVSKRAADLLARLDSPEAARRRELVPTAAVRWVARHRPAGAAGLLLDVLPHLPHPASREAAVAALWAVATPADVDRLRKAITDGPAALRAAALPALEVAAGDKAEAVLLEYLRAAEPAVRLAAARALLDRKPRESAAALVGLLDGDDGDTRTQAARLLQLASGTPGDEDRGLDWPTAVARWKAWAASPAADRPRPVGAARLRVERYGLLFAATFATESQAIGDGYGPFRYATDVNGKAAVVKGVLRLEGDHPEGDQRLTIAAEKALGKATFPKAFQVKAAMGGEAAMSGAWHVGVSVGGVRVLFHADHPGGAFRVERTADKHYLLTNTDMGFTPAGGVLHDVTIDVAENPDGTVRLDVRIAEPGKPGREFRKAVTVAANDVGPVSRVGLERSGRTGGAALFGSLTIRQEK